MEYTHILIRYGELFLKGKNRSFFEKRLVKNIGKITGVSGVEKPRGRLIVPYFEGHEQLKRVFGIASYSPSLAVEKDMSDIKKAAVLILGASKGKFRIRTKRSDKTFPLTSTEVNAKVGQYVEENTDLEFSLLNFDLELHIEINQQGVFLFTESVACFGGLPTGVEGKVLLLVEDELSLLAGLLLMKRGCHIFPISLDGQKDISLLRGYSPVKLELREFTNYDEVEKFAVTHEIDVIASAQRFENYHNLETNLTVLRPMIAYTENDQAKELLNFQPTLNN